ncbi:MAG: aminotransferase class V-fold PLP-dependent enzyme [Alphaproteobacteria bacterium]|nr:aminotransferase class V-fold PLP-dependent enzyme [Alphaproteobacteria bacterium]
MSWKQHFSRSVGRIGAPLHFAAHSHHPWPDVTLDAQQQYWLDSAQRLDKKWEHVFGEMIPAVQRHIAGHLALPNPGTIAFAPNTHSFLLRLLSATPVIAKHNVLSTDAEFHSFTRQMDRLSEDGLVSLVRVPVEPFATFKDRFIAQLKTRDDWDMVWLSHVFFNSGWVLSLNDLTEILAAIPSSDTFAVIDGYHAFMAIPVDLAAIAGRAFYLAGGYKYAMAGEGACFMHCPPGYGARPRDTGWYAEFGALGAARESRVPYGTDGSRFAGATYDPSGLYRLQAVMAWLASVALDVKTMDSYCLDLKREFLRNLDAESTALSSRELIVRDLEACGRFLTFRTTDAARIDRELAEREIIVDHRADRLRIGFGIYQDAADVHRLVKALSAIV